MSIFHGEDGFFGSVDVKITPEFVLKWINACQIYPANKKIVKNNRNPENCDDYFTMINWCTYFPRVCTMYDQSSSLNKQINQLWLSKIGLFGYFLALFLYLQDMGHSDTKMKFLNI